MAPTGSPPPPELMIPRLDLAAGFRRTPGLALAAWDGAPPQLPTEVRLGTFDGRLFASFRCAHAELHADPSLPRDRPVEGLWRRDVVELFLAADAGEGPYIELEASPYAQWLALAFSAPRTRSSDLPAPRPQVEARIGGREHHIQMSVALADLPFPAARLRIGLFRIHGREPARGHLALTPNGSPAPDFHRPSSWARFEVA